MPTSGRQQRDDSDAGGRGWRVPRCRVPTGCLVRDRHRPELAARRDHRPRDGRHGVSVHQPSHHAELLRQLLGRRRLVDDLRPRTGRERSREYIAKPHQFAGFFSPTT